MATSFVEQATLRINDQSSKTLRNINQQLDKLFATTNKRKQPIFDERNLNNAERTLRRLLDDVNRLNRQGNSDPFDGVEKGARQARNQTRMMGDDIKRIANTRLRVNLTWEGALANALGGAAASIGAEIARGFRREIGQVGQAINAAERTEQYYGMVGTDPVITGLIREAADREATRNPLLTATDTLNMLAEVAKNNPELLDTQTEAGAVVAALSRNSAALMASGRTQDQAANEIASAFKIAEQLGRPGDTSVIDALVKGSIAGGGDVSLNQMLTASRNLGSSKTGLSNEALTFLTMQADEMGIKAGSGYRTVTSNLLGTGATSAERMAFLEQRGLAGGENVSLLARDPLSYVDKVARAISKEGVDINNPGDVAEYLSKGFTQTGAEWLAPAITRREELRRNLGTARDIDLAYAVNNPTTAQSFQGLETQFQQTLVEAVKPLTPLVRGVTQDLTSALQAVTSGQGGAADYTKLGVTTLGAGMIFGAQALVDPASRPLGAAALALTSSASALTASATALTGAATVQAVGGKGSWIKGAFAGGLSALSKGKSFLAPLAIYELMRQMKQRRPDQVVDNFSDEQLPNVYDRFVPLPDKPIPVIPVPSPGVSPLGSFLDPAKATEESERRRAVWNINRSVPDDMFGLLDQSASALEQAFQTGSMDLGATFQTGGQDLSQGIASGGTDAGISIGNSIREAGAWVADTLRGAIPTSIAVRSDQTIGLGPALDTGRQMPSE